MGMGGGSGGAAIPQAGLTPLQQEQFRQGQQLVDQNTIMTQAMQGRLLNAEGMYDSFRNSQDSFMAGQRKFVNENAKLARGGLMAQGLGQVSKGLGQGPDMGGVMARSAARLGVAATPEQQAAMDQSRALSQASTRVGIKNQARQGLAGAQRDMRFAGY